MRIRPTRHNECEITTENGTRITVTVNAQPPVDNEFVTLKRFIELELAKIEPQWIAEGKGSYWWGVKIGLETVLKKLCEMDGAVMANAPQPERRRYDPHGSLSEYGIFPECDAQPLEEDKSEGDPPSSREAAPMADIERLPCGVEHELRADATIIRGWIDVANGPINRKALADRLDRYANAAAKLTAEIKALQAEIEQLRDAAPAAQAPRACTCHPDDRPDGPCRERYAASECQALAAQEQTANADDEVVFYDGVGAARSSVKSCRDGVRWIKVGDRIYWPLSDSDAKRLHSACCGDGSFDGPASPAGEGEEVMVNTPYGVFVLPLQPSELSSGPRFVVHVPSPEAPAVKALVEALETCLETEERPEVIELAKTALAAASQLARDGCHCGTCTCDPNMTPAVRFDLSPAQMEGAIRDHLIRLGWTPPDERAQHAAPTPVVDWTSLTAAQKEAWGQKMFQEAARGLWRCRSVTDQLLHWNGIPVHVTGTVTTSPSNWSLIDAALTTQQQEQPVAVAVDEAMVERIATLLYEEATAEPSGPDRDYYRGLARKIAALVTTHQEPTT